MSLWEVFDPGGLSPSNPDSHKNPKNNKNPSAEALAEISRALFEQTSPLRGGLIDRSNAFLAGDLDVTKSPMYAAMKTAVDSQFNRAKDNTIARTAAGGGLVDALSGLESDRAQTMTANIGQLAQGELDRSFGLATGILPTSTSGLGNAAAIQGNQLSEQAAMQQQTAQSAGMGLGMLLAK